MSERNTHCCGSHGQLTVRAVGAEKESAWLESLAGVMGVPVVFDWSEAVDSPNQDVALDDIDVVIVSLADDALWRERLDSIETLTLQKPVVVLCEAHHQSRSLEAIRRGARDWLIEGQIDASGFDAVLQRVVKAHASQQRIESDLRLCRSVVDDQLDLICRFRPDGGLTFVNRAYATHFGRSVEELEGKSFLCNVPEEEHQRVFDQLAALTREAPSSTFDHAEEVEGRIVWLQWTDSALFDSDGQLLEYQSTGTDITIRRKAEQAATDSEARYRALYENAPVMMHVIDSQGRLESVNQCWLDTLGHEESDVLGKLSFSFLTEESQALARSNMRRIAEGNGARDLALRFRRADGQLIDVLVTATALRDSTGSLFGAVFVGVEVTEHFRALRELEKEKERLRITLASIGDAVITTDHVDLVDYLNPAAEILTGWSSADANGLKLIEVFAPFDPDTGVPQSVEIADDASTTEPVTARLFRRQQDKEAIVDFNIAPIQATDGRSFGRVLVFRDTTQAQELSERMSYQANHDPLTGLLNRRAFEERLARALETSSEGTTHVLCFLDLDRFKLVNDSCGHEAGDRVLCELGELMQSRLRNADTFSRLGGDEFAVLLEHCPEARAREIADGMRSDVAAYRFRSNEHSFSFGVSIGLVIVGDDCTVASALRAADSACYAAKAAGRNRLHFYTGDGAESLHNDDDSIWAQRVNDALDEDRFSLLAQPIEEGVPGIASGTCFEVLLRMRDENEALIPPGAFIPAAERFGLMTQIDRWVVKHVFEWLGLHRSDLDHLEHCAINLSGRSLDEPDFLTFVLSAFDETGIPPEKVCFEITETAAIASVQAAQRFMNALKERGCRFSLDDFGSGLSSFAYLRSLPVDYLKIDGLFVRDIIDDETDLAMVRTINEIAHVLGKRTVAEYVENDLIRAVLTELGVDWVQGYGVGRPVPIEAHWEEVMTRRAQRDGKLPRRAA